MLQIHLFCFCFFFYYYYYLRFITQNINRSSRASFIPADLQQHVSGFDASVRSHSPALHDGADVDAAIPSFVALAHNANTQEVVLLCIVETSQQAFKNKLKSEVCHSTKILPLSTDPCWAWRWWCSGTSWNPSRCWRTRPDKQIDSITIFVLNF